MTPEQQAAWERYCEARDVDDIPELHYLTGWRHARQLGEGPPTQDAGGAYWWYKPDSQITPEPQAVFVRWVRGAVRAVYGNRLVKVSDMPGQWRGPIPLPAEWERAKGDGT